MKPTLVIFDMDGVIVDSEPLHARVRRALLLSISGGRTDTLGFDPTGTGTAAYYEAFCRRYNASETGEHAALLHYQGVLQAILAERAEPIPGVTESIQKLENAGVQLAVASSSPRFFVEGTLKHLKLLSHFSAIVCAEDVSNLKPAPDSYLTVLERLKVPASDAVAVEDSGTGIRAALSAGLLCAAYTGDKKRPQDTSGVFVRLDTMGDFAGAALSALRG